jgi:hypothetical protein
MDEVKAYDGVRQVIQRLYDTSGQVEASALVEAAQPEDSPAHAAFEWSDEKAGHEYRLIQARGWIRRVTVVHEGQEQRLIHVPKLIVTERDDANDADDASREGHYTVKSVLIKRPDEFARALSAARGRVEAARRALAELHDEATRQGKKKEAQAIKPLLRAVDEWTGTVAGAN